MYNVKLAYVENGKCKNTELKCNDIDGIIHVLKSLKNHKEVFSITEFYFFAGTITEE